MKSAIALFLFLFLLFLTPGGASSESIIAHNLFSTHSPIPWSRGSRVWFLQQNSSLFRQQNPSNARQNLDCDPNPNLGHNQNHNQDPNPNPNPNPNRNPNPDTKSGIRKHVSSAFVFQEGAGCGCDKAIRHRNREDQVGQGDQADQLHGRNFADRMGRADGVIESDAGVRIDKGDQTVNQRDGLIDGGDCFIRDHDRCQGNRTDVEMSGRDQTTGIDGDHGDYMKIQSNGGEHIQHVIQGADHRTEIYRAHRGIDNGGVNNTDLHRTLLEIQSIFEDILARYVFSSSFDSPMVRTISIVLWLAILFYLLSTTASEYFSSLLEHLSKALNLSPAVAGVTLLAIGNGAPDVFSSVAAFVSSDTSGSIGFGAVLGSALFITTIVSGSVALATTRICKEAGPERINLVCFVRDALFLLASASVLMVILVDAKVYLWEALCFLCVYVVYAASVWAAEMLENRHRNNSLVLDPLVSKAMSECALPQWASTTSKWCYYHPQRQDHEVELEYFYDKYYAIYRKCKRRIIFLYKYGIERPLAVPRLLTIPVIEEERWSRPLAVTTCTLAPLFIGCILLFHCHEGQTSMNTILEVSGGIGVLLGALAFCNTENARPPQRFIWLWLAGGFFMSIVWFYVVADQLVVCLEMLGDILNINPTILGLTVLAWGNSVGDLVADVALACRGRSGVQIVVAGCYAGPLFNTVVGLGLSLAVACWTSYPEPLMISDDDGSLFFIIGFLVAGLAWALIMIPLKGRRLSRSFGAGLVLLYCGFLATGMCYAMGWILR